VDNDVALLKRWIREAVSLLVARLVRRALNRGNVFEGPLTDWIADAGNPKYQGQVATHLSRSRAMTGMGQILPFDRCGDDGGSGIESGR